MHRANNAPLLARVRCPSAAGQALLPYSPPPNPLPRRGDFIFININTYVSTSSLGEN